MHMHAWLCIHVCLCVFVCMFLCMNVQYVTCFLQDNCTNTTDVVHDWQCSSNQFAMTVSFSSASLHSASSFVDVMRSSPHLYHVNDTAQHFRWDFQCSTSPFTKAAPAFRMFCHSSSSECYFLPASAATVSTDQLHLTVTPWVCPRVNATILMCTAASKCAIA